MKPLLAACLLIPGLALADGAVTVRLPDLSEVADADLWLSLTNIVTAIVIGQNCTDYLLTDGEWALLNGSADVLAARLGLTTKAYEAQYWDPAFALLDSDFACSVGGPDVRPLLDELIDLGGSTVPVN